MNRKLVLKWNRKDRWSEEGWGYLSWVRIYWRRHWTPFCWEWGTTE